MKSRGARRMWLDGSPREDAAAASVPGQDLSARIEQGLGSASNVALLGGAIGVALVLTGVVTGPLSGDAAVTAALGTGCVLAVLTWFVARRLADVDGDESIVPIVMSGFCVKMAGAVIRYIVTVRAYTSGDFYDYDRWGRTISTALRSGNWVSLPGRFAGTNFLRLVTGIVYTVSPRSIVSGFVVFAWLSYLGLLFFWRACRLAVSPVWHKRYLAVLVLLPTLAYWPSSIGKDAYMVLAVGIASYGVACLFVGRVMIGAALTAVGLLGTLMVRPHIGLVVCGGLVLAAVFRRYQGGVAAAFASIIFTGVAVFVTVKAAVSFLGIHSLSRNAIVQQLNNVADRTAQGGSNFSPVVVRTPLDLPRAAVTVLYRPFPFEAHSPQEMVTALEGVALAIATVVVFRRAAAAIRRSRDTPYLLYAFGALLTFIVALSGFSNFGILARQRAVIEPLLLLFLAMPRGERSGPPTAAPVGAAARSPVDHH